MESAQLPETFAGKRIPDGDDREDPSRWHSRDRYKLIHFYYDVDEWELYDLKTDPMEMRNVYEHPEYAVVREMMHTKLEEVRNYYGDSDVLNEKYLQKYLDQQTAK